jgi:6-phosphogluconolactonase (cycloisomerase 2 family)
VLVVEAGANAVSSYSIDSSDSLRNISSSVANGQHAVCWIATNGNRYLFTANPGSSTLSSFKLNADTGAVSLLAASAGAVGKPLDIGVTKNGHYLYALDAGNLQIDAFEVGQDGSLTNLGPINGGFATYAQGLVVR